MLHYTIELDTRKQSDYLIYEIEQQLEAITEKNKQEYYKIYLEHYPALVINISSNGTVVELLNNNDLAESNKTIRILK